jgi:hypothetical protein
VLGKIACPQLIRWGILAGLLGLGHLVFAQTDLTVDVLINSTNTAGYSTTAPVGEYQRYPERYLEHLQIPYRVIDVSNTAPGSVSGLASTPLIIAGHRGLNLSPAWQQAIVAVVQGGAGFVNLDWDTTIGTNSHMQQIFGCSSSAAGTPGTSITLPAAFLPDGATPHYIAGLQMRFPIGNPASASGDLVYNFHVDDNNVLNTATSTICLDAQGHPAPGGTVLATIGSDALLTATTFGSGNAVNFGTYDYLRADRFGFVMGLDDLFWRSLVWAARKPFVMRGHPRLFAVQQDDTVADWETRVQEMFNTSFTGSSTTETLLDGSTINVGGPWRVTGYILTTSPDFNSGSAARQTVLDLVNAANSFLRVTPLASTGISGGDLYWTCPCPPSTGAPLTDSQWTANFDALKAFQAGNGPTGSKNGGNDFLPFAAHVVPHFWDLSDNAGTDLQSLGFRYISEIQQPNVFYSEPAPGKTPAQRLPGTRPFRLYEQPPAGTPVANPNELWPVYWADDYTVHSTAAESAAAVTFFGFATQLHGMAYPTYFAVWPDAPSIPDATALENWQAYIWRFWSAMAPVQVYTQDPGSNGTASERQNFITSLSSWAATNGAGQNINIFMDDLGAYLRARTKSTLTGATLDNNDLTISFAGSATDGNNSPTNTYALIFRQDNNGDLVTVPGFPGPSFTTAPIAIGPPPVVETNSTLQSASNPSIFGTQITFNASVTSSAVSKPTGNISLLDGATQIASTTLDSNGNASFNIATLSGGDHSMTAHYGGDATHLPSTSGIALVQDVNKAPSSAAIGGGGAATFFGNPVTFSATVTSAMGTPTGTVSLLDGNNVVSSATVDGAGHASFTTSSLSAGVHSMSVAYQGDQDFSTAKSTAISQTVNPADFALSTATPSLTVVAGNSASATINITPSGVFGSAITFSCSGLPALANCTFNPASVTPNGAAVSTSVTLTTTGSSAALGNLPFGPSSPILATLLPGLAALLLMGQRRKSAGRTVRRGLGFLAVLTLATFICSCGGGGGAGGGGNPGTPKGTSTVVVTATSPGAGNVSRQLSITFTVQ